MRATRFLKLASLLPSALSLFAFLLAASTLQAETGNPPLLLRNPSLSQNSIAFLYGDDIWTVGRSGGEAQRLTSTGNVTEGPFFSPDGSQIAYSTRAHNSVDVYVIPSSGGIPKRITWHPAGSFAVGWTPNGKDVLFASGRISYRHYLRLFTAHADGTGTPEALPLPSGIQGSFSPDSKAIAYQSITKWEPDWKRYRGGQNFPIWIVDLKTLDLEKIPSDNNSDNDPIWIGDQIYFLSDRASDSKNGPVSLYRYDTRSKQVSLALPNHGFDLKSIQAGPGGLVYEQFGSLHLVDLKAANQLGEDHTLSIQIHGDMSRLAPHQASIAPDEIQNVGLSPTGQRVAIEAHGDIFTIPAEKGDTRNLTNTSNAAEREPSWSPDGKTIAYFSDASGEYQLYLKDQTGFKPPTAIDLGPNPSFFYNLQWSPDSRHIVYTDKHLRLWYLDAPGVDDKGKPTLAGKPVLVDTSHQGGFGEAGFDPVWSPDSKWIAYTRDLDNNLKAVFLYSLEKHTFTQVTDGMSDASSPAFDPNGKFLYFLASTDDGPSAAGIDLSSLDRAQTSAAYVVVLSKFGESPIPPESDDEKIKEEKKDDDKNPKPPTPPKTSLAASISQLDQDKKDDKAAESKDKDAKKEDKTEDKHVEVKIDLEDIGNRILALPIPPRNYSSLIAGKTGVVYLLEGPPFGRRSREGGPGIRAVWRFTTDKRKSEQVLSDVDGFLISADASKALVARHNSLALIGTDELKPGDGAGGKPLDLSKMTANIDPRAEWRQIFNEEWRIQRDFLYDPNTHGLSIPKVEARYRPYLDGLGSRSEFTYLSKEMLSEVTIGHMFVGGPGEHDNSPVTGLLGADYTVEHDRYRISKILGGQNWTPGLASPLTLPGVYVHEGAYILAVNGRELHASDNLYSFFDGTAGLQTVLHIAYNPEGKDARDVTVVPIGDEDHLRNLDWIEGNRRKVDKLSDGKVAYVYMPNTGGSGYTNFNRYFYAQLDKQALVLDERHNEGGFVADYIVDVLRRQPLSGAIERDGKPMHDPVGAIFGPKVMLINQNSGSGGDAMPWYFRKAGLGKLVGTRTWGGLVGIGGYPSLLDGGYVEAPRYAIYGLTGQWEVENQGIPPDVSVEELPKDFAAGHDAQLETGVKLVLEELKAHPIPAIPIPPYPNYHQNDGLGKN
jgi:tricorn protease